jgi:CheY-like chemotaxis protein
MAQKNLKILIIEDTPERQQILTNLYKDHAWILVHTAVRAKRLLDVFDFDLISMDYNLAGEADGDEVAAFIKNSRNADASVIVHSMNPSGAKRIEEILPNAMSIPLSKITRNNKTFKRLRQELQKGVDIDWKYVFSRKDYDK